MANDKTLEALLDALKQAVAATRETRLYRSGKLDGLFASRSGANAEAAARAIREELLEIVKTETKGKTTIEWARVTPKGVNFLHEHESPRRLLEELRHVLRLNEQHVPYWLADIRNELRELSQKVAEETARWTQQLAALGQRVEESLRRAEANEAKTAGEAKDLAWAADALAYLERRPGECPLPELFAAVLEKHANLSIITFHEGLRRLRDRQSLRLLAQSANNAELAEPEYALVDGDDVLYYAARR